MEISDENGEVFDWQLPEKNVHMELDFEKYYSISVHIARAVTAVQITEENIVDVARWIYSQGDYSVNIIDFNELKFTLNTETTTEWATAQVGWWIELSVGEFEAHSDEYIDNIRISVDEYNQKKYKYRISVDEFNERMI